MVSIFSRPQCVKVWTLFCLYRVGSKQNLKGKEGLTGDRDINDFCKRAWCSTCRSIYALIFQITQEGTEQGPQKAPFNAYLLNRQSTLHFYASFTGLSRTVERCFLLFYHHVSTCAWSPWNTLLLCKTMLEVSVQLHFHYYMHKRTKCSCTYSNACTCVEESEHANYCLSKHCKHNHFERNELLQSARGICYGVTWDCLMHAAFSASSFCQLGTWTSIPCMAAQLEQPLT